MEFKEYFEKSGLSKQAFADSIDISLYRLNKYLNGEQEVPLSILKRLDLVTDEKKEEEPIPVVDFYEDIFLQGIKRDTFLEVVNGISYTKFIFTSDKAKHKHKFKILQGKDPNDVLERLCKAIIIGKWEVSHAPKEDYIIKMPTGHHLACVNVEGKDKYVYSYSLDDFTVRGSKEELEKKFPEYIPFITEITKDYVEQLSHKFTIKQRGK